MTSSSVTSWSTTLETCPIASHVYKFQPLLKIHFFSSKLFTASENTLMQLSIIYTWSSIRCNGISCYSHIKRFISQKVIHAKQNRTTLEEDRRQSWPTRVLTAMYLIANNLINESLEDHFADSKQRWSAVNDWLIYVRVSTMTAIWTVGHRLRSTLTNGHRFTALSLPWWSPIQVLTGNELLHSICSATINCNCSPYEGYNRELIYWFDLNSVCLWLCAQWTSAHITQQKQHRWTFSTTPEETLTEVKLALSSLGDTSSNHHSCRRR